MTAIQTIPVNDRREAFIASAGQTVFPYDFPVYAAADLQVRRVRSGTETVLTLAVDYTVTGAGLQAGGNVTLTTPALAGDQITILSAQPASRLSAYSAAGDLRADALNADFNRLWIVQQQLADLFTRVLRLPPTDPPTDLTLPSRAARAGLYLSFDTDGRPVPAVGTAGPPISAYMQTLLDDPDAATAQATLGGTAVGRAVFGATTEATARAALGAQLEPGMISFFPFQNAPAGWLKANGALVSRTVYAALFAAASADGLVSEAAWAAGQQGRFGAGNGSTTFRLPDLRGEFVRGWDDGRGIDTGRASGSFQAADMASHNHTGTTAGNGAHSHGNVPLQMSDSDRGNTSSAFSVDSFGQTDVQGFHDHAFTTNNTGGVETRPRNVALLACVKF